MLTLTLTPSLAEAELISPMSLRILSLWEALNVDVWITMWPTSWHASLSQGEAYLQMFFIPNPAKLWPTN